MTGADSLAAAAEPMPGQLALPGLEPEPDGDGGQRVLPGMEDLRAAPVARAWPRGAADPQRDQVAVALRAADPDFTRLAGVLRRAFDLLLDGQHTGRYRWDQLHKTEKTHAGTLVEIGLQRALGLADGTTLDYCIAGAEVDCKFSHRTGGWMIPPEAAGHLLLLVQASDEEGTWSAGLLRALPDYLAEVGNRDLKRALNDTGREAIAWLARGAPLPENALLRLSERDTAAIFGCATGQAAVNELFRRALGRRISRAVVATVARQDDYMKRVRGGGGARDQLRGEGIVIFGDYAGHQALAVALGLPSPGPGEFVSARLAPRDAPGDRAAGERAGGERAAGERAAGERAGSERAAGDRAAGERAAGERAAARRYVRLDGADWVLAGPGACTGPAPRLPRV